MLSLPLPVRIYLCTRPVDLRKSFDGLAQLVREFLGVDPLSGHLFAFRNKRGDRLKLLYWDRDGYMIVYKSQEAHCNHSLPFTEFAKHPHNLARRSAALGRMGRNSGRRTRR
jgi:transposase